MVLMLTLEGHKVTVDISELKQLIETDCLRSVKYDSNHLFDIPLIPWWSSFFNICCDQQYQRPFENQQMYYEQNYLHQEPSLLTQLGWGVHRKLNNVIKSQIVVNVLTCISQENHKFCYTPSFPRFY